MFEIDALNSPYDDTLKTPDDAANAESKLSEQPEDTLTRAQLIHYYFSHESEHARNLQDDGRLRHTCWFIENFPELKFCGGAQFYFNESDDRWESVRGLWIKVVANSPGMMTRINACMAALSAEQELGEQWLSSLFPNDSTNIWVRALRDLSGDSNNCFKDVVEAERSNSNTIDEACRIRLTRELKTKKNWELLDERNWEQECDLYSSWPIGTAISLETAQTIAFCTLSNFETNSILGFDPDLIALRFYLACWVVRHIPYSKLASNPIFTGPFEHPRRYDFFGLDSCKSLECLFINLGDIWIEQLKLFPRDKAIAKNATMFATRAAPFFRTVSRSVFSQLKEN